MSFKKTTTFFLVRHGETPWTAERRYQGLSDTSLSAVGLKQSRELAKRLKSLKIDRIYTSRLKRTKETALAVSKALKLKLTSDGRLNEFHFGAWEGRTAKEMLASREPAFLKWCSGKWVNPPQGESLKGFKSRVGGFFKETLERNRGKNLLLISHGGPIKMMIFEALNLSFRSFWNLRIDTASISVITCYSDFAQLTLLNDTGHLQTLKKKK